MFSRWNPLCRPAPQNSAPHRKARLDLTPLEDRIVPVTAFSLSGSNLLRFDTTLPVITQTTPITAVNGSETLVGIDFRPQNGLLYGLGVNGSANTATLYAISTRTGVATAVGPTGGITFTTDGVAVVDLPDPATVGYGFDFNPAADRIRVVAGGLNFRVNPNTGAAVDGDNTGLTSTPGNGINPDGSITGIATTVDGAGYTNNQPNNGNITTLYVLDASTNRLLLQAPPNVGTTTLVGTVTLSAATLDFTAVNGFDIPVAVNAAASDAPVTTGPVTAFAVLNVGGTTSLYSINLTNAQATFVGDVGNGTTAVQGLALQNDLGSLPAIALDASGTSILRFNTATPGTTTTQPLDALPSGFQFVGIDFRPSTGQLFGLAVSASTDTGTLYRIDPQTGTIAAVGAGFAFVQFDGTTPIDLPDPATAGYGIDFNPTVDLLRVTTSTGLSFRVSPVTGAGVDSDGTAGNGANPDAVFTGLVGGATGLGAAAYTDSFGTGGSPATPAGVTTLYTLEAIQNSLYILNPSTGAVQSQLSVTVGGSPLNFTDVNGFDIPAGVSTSASNTPVASGFGYAVLTVGGTTSMYRIDLTSGAATLLGAIGTGTTPLAGLALGDTPSGSVAFTSATSTLAENGGAFLINLTRIGSTVGSLTVTVNVVSGNAAAGSDFTGGPYTATFADGATSASFTIPVANDILIEGDQTIGLAIAGVSNAGVIATPSNHVATILDNDFWNSIILEEPLTVEGFVYPSDANQAIVDDIYRILLGRHAEPAGLLGWASVLQSTGSAQAVVDGVFNSAEHRGRQVANYYQEILGRTASAAEIQGWVNLFGAGLTEEQVISGFLNSAEFSAGKTDTQFVQALYDVLLLRTADTPGLQGWVNFLSGGGTRAEVSRGILLSPEYGANAVSDFYESFLLRTADAASINGWVQLYVNGLSEAAIVKAFLDSEEFENLAR